MFRISESWVKWGLIVLLAVVDIVWLYATGLRIAVQPHIAILLSFFCILAFVYSYLRPNERIAEFANTFGQMFCFGMASVVATYLMAAANFPLVDRYLDAADRYLGFDWLRVYNWLSERPALHTLATLAYHSYVPQILFLMLFFNLTGRLDRSREFITLFMLSTFLVVPWSMVIPAASAWVQYGVAEQVQAYHLKDFYAVRSGELREIAVSATSGLVTFPSLHTTHALTFMYITRGIRFLTPIWLCLNTVMLFSIPTIGGHYLIDVIAGALLFGVALLILNAMTPKLPREVAARLAA